MSGSVFGWGVCVVFGACLAWSCAHIDDRDCSATRTCAPTRGGAAGQGGQGGAQPDDATAGAPRED